MPTARPHNEHTVWTTAKLTNLVKTKFDSIHWRIVNLLSLIGHIFNTAFANCESVLFSDLVIFLIGVHSKSECNATIKQKICISMLVNR